MEVRVLGDDHEAVVSGITPNGLVIGLFQTLEYDLAATRIGILQEGDDTPRQILVEQ